MVAAWRGYSVSERSGLTAVAFGMTPDEQAWEISHARWKLLFSDGEERNRQNHFRVNLRQTADIAVRQFVRLAVARILTLDLHRANQLMTAADILSDDEIEAFVAMGEIDVPPCLRESPCNE